MAKMLVINAHPKVESKEAHSLQVLEHFMKSYKELNQTDTIEQVNLYDDYIPMVDSTFLRASEKLVQQEELTDEERRVLDRSAEILKQFKEATKYVICMPLHNFNIPSKLKDYIDNFFIPREVYKFTENGSVGLLKDGRSLLVIQASGSVYTNNDWYTEMEFSHKYLKAMFNFLGIEDYRIVRAEGTAILNLDDVLNKAFKEAEEAAKHLADVDAKVVI